VTTYWEYLKLDQLLALQNGLDGDVSGILPDELHFIIVHQVFELWFKLILNEMRMVRDSLAAPAPPQEVIPVVLHRLDRINKTLAAAAQQWEVMETVKPQDFLDFRDKLFPASGFQSFQFPEIEILMGLEETLVATTGASRSLDQISRMADRCEAGARAWTHIERVRKEKTLRSALFDWFTRWPIPDLTAQKAGDESVVSDFLRSYLTTIREYHAIQIQQLMAAPGASRAAIESKFADSYREAEEFLMALDTPESERQRQQRIRASILYIETYSDLPGLTLARMVISSVLDLESVLLLWRTRHARMAERVIGRRVGTGGTSVTYLDQTLGLRVFTDLWAARTQVLPRHLAPALNTRPATLGNPQ
jgi:tryptophan 2,3-dioxygenase